MKKYFVTTNLDLVPFTPEIINSWQARASFYDMAWRIKCVLPVSLSHHPSILAQNNTI